MTAHKILLLAPSLQDMGGVASFCKLLIENLNSDYDVEYFQIGNRPWNDSSLKRILYFFRDGFRLINKLSRQEFDIIHLNPSFKILSLSRDSLFLTIIINLFHRRTLVLFHGWNNNLANRIASNIVYKRLVRKTYNKVGIVLVLCNQFRQQLVNIGICPEKIKVITTMYKWNPISLECKNNKLGKKVNILFMSRLVKSKGIYIAVEVAKILLDNGYRDFKIVIAGDGPEYERLINYINKNKLNNYIETSGYITGKKKQKILEDSDIFLFPTHYGDGCPIVVLEAMGAALAVISTPVAAIPDIIRHNKNGFIIDSKDPEEFFKAVKKLIDNRELLRRIQEYNKQEAEENYEAKIVTRKMESIYSSIIHEGNSEKS